MKSRLFGASCYRGYCLASWIGCCTQWVGSPNWLLQIVGQSSIFIYGVAIVHWLFSLSEAFVALHSNSYLCCDLLLWPDAGIPYGVMHT